MKISLYLKHRKAERLRFKYDLYRIMVSLRARQYNWRCHYDFDLKNEAEDMYVWISNEEYGMKFTVEGRKYGGVDYVSSFLGKLTWRRKLLRIAREAMASPRVEKHGLQWNLKTTGKP